MSGQRATNNRRYLVVNADDFGMSPGVSRGILAAHAHGIVTSTSLMVRPPGSADAVAMSREYPALGIGLHVDLCEWEYIDGEWKLSYEVVPLLDEAAVADEVIRQYDRFRELVGREPTHIDSHQHFHLRHPVRQHLLELAERVGVPLRHCTPGLHYVSRFYGQSPEGTPEADAITVRALVRILGDLPTGVVELACHPGDASDLDTHYRSERAVEQRVLCDPAVRVAVEREGITLCSFADVADLLMLPRE
jgi:predicted glycoside hydrolase/deacetylase ChbG (UPF0249 family)